MRAIYMGRLLIALCAVGILWVMATPAQAQLAGGCSCPVGFAPLTSTTCHRASPAATVSATCPYNNIGHIAAAQQQQSFWGINTVLQQKRDQLQNSTPVNTSHSSVTGYAASSLDSNARDSSAQSQKNNPLASKLYDDATATAAPSNPVYGAWTQGMLDTEHDSALAPGDTTHSSNTYTAQAGIDRTQRGIFSADDALVVGLVGSWMHTHTGYDGTPTTMDLSGPGIGIYSEYVKGGFSADLTTKFDFLRMNQDFGGTAPSRGIGITNSGLNGNTQYKFTGFLGSDKNFFEPTTGFSLTHTGFGTGATAFGVQDGYTIRLQVGARVGTSWDAGQGVTVDSSLKVLAYGDPIAQGTSIVPVTPFSPTISPSDTGLVRGEIDPEICLNLPHDYSLTFSGQVRFGEALVGGSAGINLRKQF